MAYSYIVRILNYKDNNYELQILLLKINKREIIIFSN